MQTVKTTPNKNQEVKYSYSPINQQFNACVKIGRILFSGMSINSKLLIPRSGLMILYAWNI